MLYVYGHSIGFGASLLTVQLLDGDRVVVGKSEVALVSLVPRIHQRSGNGGMGETQSVADLVCRHQEQIHTWQ